MRLNTYQKEAIVRAIMQDVPKMDDEKTKVDIQAALVKAMSPAVRKLYRENPRALQTMYGSEMFHSSRHHFVVGDADFFGVTKPWVDKARERDQARKQLQDVVNGCTTLKQLKKLLPEFERYMPTENAPTKNLPVVANAVSTLVKLGWPKEQVSE